MTDGREIANFCAHIQQHKPVDTRLRPTPTIGRSQKDSGGEQPL